MKGKVLIFIDWFAPGYKAGGPTTSNINITEHLCDEIDFYVITSDTDYRETTPYANVIPNCWTMRNNIHVYYFSKDHLCFHNIVKVAREANCPVWYINGVYSRYFSFYPLVAKKLIRPKRTIVSARGMLSPHALAVKSKQKKLFLWLEKITGLYRNILFHSTNESESDHIKYMIGRNIQTIAIENLPRKVNLPFSIATKKDNAIRLVSFARISPEKNTLYAIEALSDCNTKVYYDIYGQINDTSYWNQCQKAISMLPANVKVRYRGSIAPQELPFLYKEYDMMYLPTTGENFGHAILESFINSRPVLISDKTPWRNLTQQNIGYDLTLSDKNNFTKVIDVMAELNFAFFNKMCQSAYRFAQSVYDNPSIHEKYISLLTQ